jgi:hypothetical protein
MESLNRNNNNNSHIVTAKKKISIKMSIKKKLNCPTLKSNKKLTTMIIKYLHIHHKPPIKKLKFVNLHIKITINYLRNKNNNQKLINISKILKLVEIIH